MRNGCCDVPLDGSLAPLQQEQITEGVLKEAQFPAAEPWGKGREDVWRCGRRGRSDSCVAIFECFVILVFSYAECSFMYPSDVDGFY